MSLRGAAQRLLLTLTPAEVRDYATLCKALESRFGAEGQQELFMFQLQSRSKKAKESFKELGDDIGQLASEAYAGANVA